MKDKIEKRMKILRFLGKLDEEYERIEEEYRQWEVKFTEMVSCLEREQQDIVWGFVCTSDALDHRLLEIACELIDLNKV